jgi:hypothetical protein
MANILALYILSITHMFVCFWLTFLIDKEAKEQNNRSFAASNQKEQIKLDYSQANICSWSSPYGVQDYEKIFFLFAALA